MEHRCGQRVRFGRIVRVTATGDWTATASVRDLSVSVAFLVCSKPPQSVTWLRLEILDQPQPVVIIADVVRWTSEGVGVEWQEFAPLAVKEVLASLQRIPPTAISQTLSPTLSRVPSAARARILRR